MNKETIEGNKTIAEFMDAKFYPQWTSEIYKEPHPTFDFGDQHPTEDSSRYWSPETLQYHSSWDWLMPVVEKINKICRERGGPLSNHSRDQEHLENPLDNPLHWKSWSYHTVLLITDINNVFGQVINFIQWYNSQSKTIRL